jgi:alginate O-acetyltransferase complex protein AlgJ
VETQEPDRQPETLPTVSRWFQVAVTALFVVMIAIVPVVQIAGELRAGEPVQELDIFHGPPTLDRIEKYEGALEDNSVVADAVRGPVQWMGLVTLGAGNTKTVPGRNDTLIYRPSLDAIVGADFMRKPWPDGHPVPAIVDFRDSLADHAVSLILLVVPGKQTIYPEWLSGGAQPSPPTVRGLPAFMAAMRENGVNVVDPTDALWAAKDTTDLYLREDTHWTPAGLDIVADELARGLRSDFEATLNLRVEPVTVTRPGDLYDMLQLPNLPTRFIPQTVTVNRVIDADAGAPLEPDATSPVALLGDSFTNIYSLPDMGWGDHAGLGEQLALRLSRSVDIIALNDGGVNTARASLARRRDSLAGKRVVIWQFAARDLAVSNGDWQFINVAGPQEE